MDELDKLARLFVDALERNSKQINEANDLTMKLCEVINEMDEDIALGCMFATFETILTKCKGSLLSKIAMLEILKLKLIDELTEGGLLLMLKALGELDLKEKAGR